MPRSILMAAVLMLAAGCDATTNDGVSGTDAPLVRLTPDEHANTVRDLFGQTALRRWVERIEDDEDLAQALGVIDDAFPLSLPGDQPVHGFEGQAEGQVSSAYHIQAYQAVARGYAPMIRMDGALLACGDWDARDEAGKDACGRDTMMQFAQRAWRRPTTTEEQQRLEALWTDLRTERDPAAAMEGMAEALLQTPAFLYRLDDPQGPADGAGIIPLTSWEMASRLSYALWDSMPDAELFAAAAADALQTREQVVAQARRMLMHPKARPAVVRFHRQWLDIDDVFSVRANLDHYADVYAGPTMNMVRADAGGDELEARQDLEEAWSTTLIGYRRAMSIEADLFFEQTIFERSGTLAELFTSSEGFVTTIEAFGEPVGTQDLHGGSLEVDRSGRARVMSFDDGNIGYRLATRPAQFDPSKRAGLLTLPGFLAVHSHPVHPAPILRGVHLLEKMLCEPVGQPPAEALNAEVPDVSEAEGTNRERLASITSSPGCMACHGRINPMGFAFEHYDTLGGYRERDNDLPVDASGTLKPHNGPEMVFSDAIDLGKQMATHPSVQDCYAKQWTQYLLGGEIGRDDPSLAEVQAAFREGGHIPDLLVNIVASDAFRFRTK
jgi:hypothetical protein